MLLQNILPHGEFGDTFNNFQTNIYIRKWYLNWLKDQIQDIEFIHTIQTPKLTIFLTFPHVSVSNSIYVIVVLNQFPSQLLRFLVQNQTLSLNKIFDHVWDILSINLFFFLHILIIIEIHVTWLSNNSYFEQYNFFFSHFFFKQN